MNERLNTAARTCGRCRKRAKYTSVDSARRIFAADDANRPRAKLSLGVEAPWHARRPAGKYGKRHGKAGETLAKLKKLALGAAGRCVRVEGP